VTETTIAATTPVDADLDGFRRAQRLAYDCAEAVAATLEPGVTEKDAAHAMRRWLSDAGVDSWFHLPFAWFGDRTAFRGFRLPHQFFPTNRALEETMPFILDVAPVVDGYTADIGFSSSVGANVVADSLADDLAQHRSLILAEVRAGASQGEVYRSVDKLLARQGNDNRHQAYPFGVIAHRVGHAEGRLGRGHRTAFGFGVGPTATLFRSVVAAAPARRSPLWNRGRFSIHPPVAGLWAVEPHLGRGAVGAKFEELLVVTGDGAFWLDDDLPHVQRWHERGLA
jgi:Xaa-Pro aminopeptidase